MPAWIDLTGKQFGNLLIKEYAGKSNWVCECLKCKRTYIKQGCVKLRAGRHTQCGGCRAKQCKTHGHKPESGPSKTYKCWSSMIERCHNPKHKTYFRYGARGISVCDRWRKSFQNFLHDMGEVPIGKTIDRVMNRFGYSPENCRWATRIEQANNKTTNRFVIFNGLRMTYSQAALEIGCSPGLVWLAIKRASVPKSIVPFLVVRSIPNKRRSWVVLFGEQGGLFGSA